MTAPGAAIGVIVLVLALVFAASSRTTWLIIRYRISRIAATALVIFLLLGALTHLATTPE
ncbi:hypothetical protein KIF24_16855 [Micromonospora sp. Llam7]|uniref:hypothetical protein n=1 Tax=Micromonospora tarapacensis TaxID=2835305 RepID=UPI001C83085A|nr:hypothetical protein [Micromonospora tarapacensis]MBX7267534.1 hypothetical protein [Micromonospora tarapacensis]